MDMKTENQLKTILQDKPEKDGKTERREKTEQRRNEDEKTEERCEKTEEQSSYPTAQDIFYIDCHVFNSLPPVRITERAQLSF